MERSVHSTQRLEFAIIRQDTTDKNTFMSSVIEFPDATSRHISDCLKMVAAAMTPFAFH